MPLYLVRKTFVPGPMTVTAPDIVTEYEVVSASLGEASAQIGSLRPGERPENVTVRTTHDPYTNAYIAPPVGRYEAITDIVEGTRKTPPKASPLHGVAEATRAIFEKNAELTGIDDEGNPSIAIYHVLHAVIGYAASAGVSLKRVVYDIHNDYEAMTGDEPPELKVPAELPESGGDDAENGKALATLNAYELGLDTDDDPEIALFHLMVTLINYADHADIDMQGALDEVIRDRVEAMPKMGT